MDLALDPGDGREVGLRLKRHEPMALPDLEPNPYVDTLNAEIAKVWRSMHARMAEDAAVAARLGLRITNVDVRTEWVGEYAVRAVGTYRVVQAGETA